MLVRGADYSVSGAARSALAVVTTPEIPGPAIPEPQDDSRATNITDLIPPPTAGDGGPKNGKGGGYYFPRGPCARYEEVKLAARKVPRSVVKSPQPAANAHQHRRGVVGVVPEQRRTHRGKKEETTP